MYTVFPCHNVRVLRWVCCVTVLNTLIRREKNKLTERSNLILGTPVPNYQLRYMSVTLSCPEHRDYGRPTTAVPADTVSHNRRQRTQWPSIATALPGYAGSRGNGAACNRTPTVLHAAVPFCVFRRRHNSTASCCLRCRADCRRSIKPVCEISVGVLTVQLRALLAHTPQISNVFSKLFNFNDENM